MKKGMEELGGSASRNYTYYLKEMEKRDEKKKCISTMLYF
jgi:hypothetical protein